MNQFVHKNLPYDPFDDFAIVTTPKSKKPKSVEAIAFAKSTAVTTNVGTMQIKGLSGVPIATRE